MMARVNSCFSRSKATSSARCAEVSAATTMQTMATATTTQSGTTTPRRVRSQPVGLDFACGSPDRGASIANTCTLREWYSWIAAEIVQEMLAIDLQSDF